MKFFLTAMVIMLGGCMPAQMNLHSTLTERGVIATRGTTLGQVLLWSPNTHNVGPASVVASSGNPEYYLDGARPGDLEIKFTGKAQFAGGAKLTASEEVELEAEVGSKSSLRLVNSIKHGFETPAFALKEAINAAPEKWASALEYEIGFPADPNETYIVMAYAQSLADKITVEVDRQVAVGAEFESKVVKVSGANLKYQIQDAASLTLSKSGEERLPVFVEFVVLRMTEKANGNPQFRTVKDNKILAKLFDDLKAGN